MAKKEAPKQEKTHLENTTDKIGEVAVHYGFSVVKTPNITPSDITKAKQFKEFDHYGDVDEKVALTRWYMDTKLDTEAQPVALHYKKPFPGSGSKKKSNQEIYGLEIMGSSRSTSEALLLKTVLAILEELGHKNIYVDINSIGDRESIARFERELQNHYRKHAHSLPAKLRQDFKKDLYSITKSLGAEDHEFLHNAPQPVGSLSDISRIHFKEVLESLETFEVMYKINPKIISNKHYASYTVFEIRELKDSSSVPNENDELLAYGYRYNHLAKKLGAKREIPSIGATIFAKKNPKVAKKVLIKNIKKPRFYLVQLGSTAKLKALNIVEMLRKNKIPVYHSITKDKITGQLTGAEYMKATHVLIMGQKEAIDNTIVVRNINNREQETVSLKELSDFLKKIDDKNKPKK
ncbi:MAG: His/Gly/Thr/Pro-type tRNA ligase C-terminal domain-containing protein [Nitrospira sp.]